MVEKDTSATTEISIAADNETLQQLLHNLYSRYETGEVRAALEQTYTAVWNETEFDHTFDLLETTPPYVSVVNKETGQRGTLLYVDTPRFYFLFNPKTEPNEEQRRGEPPL